MAAKKRKSKRRSDTSSPTTAQLEPVTFFIDRSLESKIVLEELRKAGVLVESHADHFPPDAPDEIWLREVGPKGWLVLTKDAKIRSRRLELTALLQAKVKAFVLIAKNMRGVEIAAVLVKALPAIRRTAKKNEPPFIAKIYRDSSVSIWFREVSEVDYPDL